VTRRERLGTATVVADAVIEPPRRASLCGGGKPCAKPWIDAARVSLEDLRAVRRTQLQSIQVALRIVVVVTRARIDATYGADHLGTEQYVVDRHDLEQQLDAWKMIHTGIEEHVLEQQFLERRPLHVLCQT